MPTATLPDNPQRAGKEWYAAQCVCEVCDAHRVSLFPGCADDEALCCQACGNFTMVAVEYLDHTDMALLDNSKRGIDLYAHAESDSEEDDPSVRRLVDGVFGEDKHE